MQCRECDSDNPDDGRFCDRCGASLALICAACGVPARATARFCGGCGVLLPLRGSGRKSGSEPSTRSPHSLDFARLAPLITRSVPDQWAATPMSPADRRAGAGSTVGRLMAEGERKQVTVLFADIRGSTALIDDMDPELAMAVLDPAVAAMGEAVRRFGGTVNRVQGDGVMALFGAPVACEDHAARACLAARSIIDQIALAHPTLDVRVGLNSGEVIIRSTGLDPSDYDAVGVSAHLAHRMEQMALPGTVFVTARTALLAHGFVELAKLGAHAVSGIAEPVEVFQLLAATERAAWDVRADAGMLASFVGREAEMALLEGAMGRAGLGRGQVVTLVADAGVGKSRLVHEFMKRLPAGGWAVLRASAVSHGAGAPYRLAAELLRSWLGVDPQDDRDEVRRKLRQALTLLGLIQAEEVAPLESLLDLPVSDPNWAALSALQRRERLAPALRLIVLRQSSVRPLLLMIEDLHWSDAQSEELLDGLVDGLGAARVLMIVTTRPERRPSWTSRSNRSYCVGLQLGPLGPTQADVMLRGLLGDGDDLAPLRARIVAQAEGTPLFLEELSRALLESGVVVSEPQRFRLTRDMADIQLPASVQAILASRIDRLPAERRRLLQMAAVIGKEGACDVLAAVSGLDDAELRAELLELQAAEFLYEVNLPSGLEYTFKHALTQAVAYDVMLRRQRRDLHARVLTVLEARARDRAEELTELLAEHARHGHVWDRATAYAARAGHRANARSAWREAIVFFERAQAALAHLPAETAQHEHAIDISLGLRTSVGATGNMPRVLELLDEARAVALRIDDRAKLAHIDVSRCIMLTNLGRLDVAVAVGQVSHAAAVAAADEAGALNASFALGQAHWFQGDLRLAEAVLRGSLHLTAGPLRLASTGTTGTAAMLHLVCLSKTLSLLGDFAGARAMAADAQAVAEATQKPYDLSYSRLAVGFAHLVQGASAAAAAELEVALSFARAAEILLLVPSIVRYLGRAYALMGQADQAHSVLDLAMAQTAQHGLVGLHAWCSAARGRALVSTDPVRAADSYTETLDLARRHGYRPIEAHALRMLGVLAALAGDLPDAEARLRAAATIADAIGMRPELSAIHADLSGVLRRQGHHHAADQMAAAAQALRDTLGLTGDDDLLADRARDHSQAQ